MALLGNVRNHGCISMFHLDLRAPSQMVLTIERPPTQPAGTSLEMNARWRLKPHDPARILGLSRAAGLSPLVAQLLINRGIDGPEQAVMFLEARLGSLSDPELIPGAVEAADRIVRAIRDDRKIVVTAIRRRRCLRNQHLVDLSPARGRD